MGLPSIERDVGAVVYTLSSSYAMAIRAHAYARSCPGRVCLLWARRAAVAERVLMARELLVGGEPADSSSGGARQRASPQSLDLLLRDGDMGAVPQLDAWHSMITMNT